ncbi:MAG: PHP domain-containing protein [Oscillospiraceae bacterium]|nr:PHP domain-containing protein [Oscillospiraceae bacterium]
MKRIDLHVHTTASDGSTAPADAVRLALERGLSAIAVTDHDTVSGYAEAARAGETLGVEVVPGIEISTRYEGPVHILGYFVDPASEVLRPVLDWVIRDRDARNRKMVALMAADGLPITYEDMQRRYGEVVGRPHFAAFLVELGLAADVQDAFDRFVEKGRKYYMPRSFLSIERSIEIIARAGGVPVLAHPFQYKLDDAGLRRLIEHCMASGLRGMECLYSGYTAEQSAYLLALAGEYGLLPTGGSDYHGSAKPHIRLGTGTGSLAVPYEYLERLREAAGKQKT